MASSAARGSEKKTTIRANLSLALYVGSVCVEFCILLTTAASTHTFARSFPTTATQIGPDWP